MRLIVAVLVVALPAAAHASSVRLGTRTEISHPEAAHDLPLSPPAVVVTAGGRALVAWAVGENQVNQVYAVGAEPSAARVRINPASLTVDSLHQAPGLAAGPGGEVYVSWSSRKPIPAGGLFASDLWLSRSVDGGRTFDSPLRINEDRPISHSFEGLGVAPDGTVLVSWIDSREASDKAGTYLARVVERGGRVESVRQIGRDTCVCCRIAVATGPSEMVAGLWRKVFPGDIRDMVLSLSRDGGRSFADPVRVHADRWRITACPHRGGSVAVGEGGRIFAIWYTEGTQGRPDILFATSADGRRFTAPTRITSAVNSIPDHARLAVDPAGRAAIVWEDSTAVRRRILLRYTSDGGRTLSPVNVLSKAIKAYAPDIAVGSDGTFVAAWHEDQFPVTKTVVQSVRATEKR